MKDKHGLNKPAPVYTPFHLCSVSLSHARTHLIGKHKEFSEAYTSTAYIYRREKACNNNFFVNTFNGEKHIQ